MHTRVAISPCPSCLRLVNFLVVTSTEIAGRAICLRIASDRIAPVRASVTKWPALAAATESSARIYLRRAFLCSRSSRREFSICPLSDSSRLVSALSLLDWLVGLHVCSVCNQSPVCRYVKQNFAAKIGLAR